MERQRVEDGARLHGQLFGAGLVPAGKRVEHGAELRQDVATQVRLEHAVEHAQRARVAAGQGVECRHPPRIVVQRHEHLLPGLTSVRGDVAKAGEDLVVVQLVQRLDAKELVEGSFRVVGGLGVARGGGEQDRAVVGLQAFAQPPLVLGAEPSQQRVEVVD